MTNYIDIEKLKAEIEKRAKFHDDAMKACKGLNSIAITHSAGWKEDTELLAIINSLQQEQSDVNLEKEIDMFVDGWSIDEDLGLVNDEGWSVTVGDIKNVARHFYELGKNSK
jgi:hypothetical protein